MEDGRWKMEDGRWEKGGSMTCAFLCAFATLRSIRILHSNGIHGMKAIFFRVFDVFRG